MSYWVYVHTCPSGKRYVGITTASKPERRWREGNGYQYNKHFYSAIKKYGWNNIKHEAWELTCKSEMYYAEKYLIAYYHTMESKFGYNHTAGGSSTLGFRHSEETRKEMSEIQKKIHSNPEYLKKQSEAQKERWSDSEYKGKMSKIRKERCSDPEYRKKLSEALKGKPKSQEARKHMAEAQKEKAKDPEYLKKLSKAQKEKWLDPEYREKMLEVHKGKPRSEEARKHIAEANRRKAKDPEFRRKMSEAQKKRCSDPEYRRKQSEAAKNRPRISIKLPDGTVLEMTKQNLTRNYIKKGKKFEYLS